MSATLPGYAELHCLSNFSFQRGASSAQELFARAKRLGYAALAITDECSLAGIVRAHEASQETGVALVVGAEFALADGPKLVLLAEDEAGYSRLCRLITAARRRSGKGGYRIGRADFDGTDGLLALWIPGESPEPGAARWLRKAFPQRAWLAVELHRGPDDAARLSQLTSFADAHALPCVAAGDAHMHVRGRRALQDVLTAIRIGRPVADCGLALFPNGERHLRRRDVLAGIYPAALLDESLRIARRCRFSLATLRYEYPHELVPDGRTPAQQLRTLAYEGAERRWPDGIPAGTRALIERELVLIAELSYEAFFLTVHDIVAFARSRGILCQGRGSAANSVVCYCLGITAVGPSEIGMLFERFISKERDEPPDIDVDFEHERREEVLQYVYGKYGRERAALAATVICYRPRSAARDVGRALGLSEDRITGLARVFAWGNDGVSVEQRLAERGFDPDSRPMRQLTALIDALDGFPRHLSQHVGGFVISERPLHHLVPVENAAMEDRTIIQWDKDDLETLGLLKVDCLALGMLSCIRRCLDLLRANEDRVLELATIPRDDPGTYAMIQRADTLGVFQIESRAQMAMLPRLKPKDFYDLVIEVAIVRPGPIQGKMVHPYLRRRQGLEPVEFVSEDVRGVLGRTLGVPIFQEQVMHLAMVAAGFSAGEADQLRRSMAAWKRRGGLEHWRARILEGMTGRGYPEEFAEQIFEQIKGFGSYGFPESHAASFALLVYASAWLKCHYPAAFACALLNAQPMGFYTPAQIVADARRHGVALRPPDVVHSGWDCTLEPLDQRPARSSRRERDGNSAFSPLPSGERSGVRVRAEPGIGPCDSGTSRMALGEDRRPWPGVGAALRPDPHPTPPPDGRGAVSGPSGERGGAVGVDDSSVGGSLALRLGLRQIDGIGEECAQRIAAARMQRPFHDVGDLLRRARLDRHERERLAAAGALRSLAGHRHRAFWAVAGADAGGDLAAQAPVREQRVALRPPSRAEEVHADYATTGLSLAAHPLALVRRQLAQRRIRRADEVNELEHGSFARFAGLVTVRQRPGTASGVTFLTLEDESGQVNVVVWKALAVRQRRELIESVLLGVEGVLESAQGVRHLVAKRLTDLSGLLPALGPQSRDFH